MNQATLEWMRSDWNRRAREDAFYYAGFADWKQSLETFTSSAVAAVPAIECELARLPATEEAGNLVGLEIGCGPGRLMAAMGRYFRELHGVDVSDEMIRLARGILKDSHLHARVNNGTDLSMFQDEFFHFVYSYAVFQHIPSKPVVLNYLLEAGRVLKPGGILRAQFDSLPEIEAPDTWTGCSFSAAEIAEFARANGFALLSIMGEGSHYLWVTLQRIERLPNEPERVPELLAVTTAEGARSVPQRGKGAAVSLWITGAPETSSLADFAIGFGGRTQLGCYLHSVGPGGYTFVNAPLPRNIPAGPARVGLKYRGKPVGEQEIEILPVAREPRVLSITDAVNKLSEARIACGSFKATLEDVAAPDEVVFRIGDLPAGVSHIECLDPLVDRYYFTGKPPEGLRKGNYEMKILVSGAELAATVEIA